MSNEDFTDKLSSLIAEALDYSVPMEYIIQELYANARAAEVNMIEDLGT